MRGGAYVGCLLDLPSIGELFSLRADFFNASANAKGGGFNIVYSGIEYTEKDWFCLKSDITLSQRVLIMLKVVVVVEW